MNSFKQFMLQNKSHIWIIAEHHLGSHHVLSWTREFRAEARFAQWAVHLNPALTHHRQSGCGILVDTKIITMSSTEGPFSWMRGRISMWPIVGPHPLFTTNIPIPLIACYLPYDNSQRMDALQILRRNIQLLNSTFIIAGDFNIYRYKFIRILSSWGFDIVGPHRQDRCIDFMIMAYRKFGVERVMFSPYTESNFPNWPGSDHTLAYSYAASCPIRTPPKRPSAKFWSFFRQAPASVTTALEQSFISILPPTPDPTDWPAVKGRLYEAAREVRRTACATKKKTIALVLRRIDALRNCALQSSTPPHIRKRARRKLRKSIFQLVALQRNLLLTPQTGMQVDPRKHFLKILSHIPILDRAATDSRWADYIPESDMQAGWQEAFYYPNGADCSFTPDLYERIPILPSVQELAAFLPHLKTGRSPGPDQISSDCYRMFPGLFAPHLTAYWQALSKGLMPQSHSPLRSDIVMVYKKKGERTDPSNYRPISLLNVDVKLMSSHLNRCALQYASRWFGTEQQGFLPGRWIHYNLRFILDLLHGISMPTFRASTNIARDGLMILFLDFKKAFDTVRWDYLSRIVSTRGRQSPELMCVLTSLYKQHEAIILGGHNNPTIRINTGVKQGDCSSPLLFNLALEDLITRLRTASTQGLRILGQEVKTAAYADDTTLLATLRFAVKTFDIVKQWSLESGVCINFNKSDAVVVPPDGAAPEWLPVILASLTNMRLNLHVWDNNNDIDLFTYLGIPLHTSSDATQDACSKMLLSRLQSAAGRAQRAQSFAATSVLQRSQIATSMISSVPSYVLAAVPPNATFVGEWKRVINKFVFGTRHMRPSDVVSSLAPDQGGILLWLPQVVDSSICLYTMRKLLDDITPDWVLAPMILCVRKQLPLSKWWAHSWKMCRKFGLAPKWHRPTVTLLARARQTITSLSHEDLYKLVRSHYRSLPVSRPVLLQGLSEHPKALRDWWQLPLPARVLDFGWFAIHGRNHGGINSLRKQDNRCHSCNIRVTDRWHWARSCKYHNQIFAILQQPYTQVWHSATNIVSVWTQLFCQQNSHLTRNSSALIQASYAFYASWWFFNFTNECDSEVRESRVSTADTEIVHVARRIRAKDYQWILDLTQDLLPELYA